MYLVHMEVMILRASVQVLLQPEDNFYVTDDYPNAAEIVSQPYI